MKRAIVGLMLLWSGLSYGFYDYRGEIGWVGLSGSGFALHNGSLFLNPARLGYNRGPQLGLNWNRWWGVSELNQVVFSGVYNYRENGFGLMFSSFGKSKLYLESIISLGYGRKIFNWVSMGGGIEYLYLSMSDEFGATSTIGLDLGLIVNPRRDLYIGITGKGINRMSIGGDDLSPLLVTALYFAPVDWYNLTVALEKEEHRKAFFKMGQEVVLEDLVHLRFGLRGEPTSFIVGAGVNVKGFLFDFTYLGHPDLGGDLTMGLQYRFK